MDAELAAAIRETGRLEKQARASRRALRRLQDKLVRRLGVYTLAPGEALDDREVLDFLRLAIGSTKQEVQITVTALDEGTGTQGDNHAEDQIVQRGPEDAGAARGGCHDRRGDVPSREAHTGRAA